MSVTEALPTETIARRPSLFKKPLRHFGLVGLSLLLPFTFDMDPFTALAFLMGLQAVVVTSDTIPAVLFGVPGTVGFISKWYLVLAALDSGSYVVAFMILASSLLAVVYVWRIVEVMYFQGDGESHEGLSDPPLSMLIPTWVLIGGTIYFGFTTELTAGTASEIARMLLEGAK